MYTVYKTKCNVVRRWASARFKELTTRSDSSQRKRLQTPFPYTFFLKFLDDPFPLVFFFFFFFFADFV